jgi:hypothetical protein
MYVLRHDHIADDHKLITPSHLLQDFDEEIPSSRRPQHHSPLVAAEGNEVQIPRAVISFETCGHRKRVEARP